MSEDVTHLVQWSTGTGSAEVGVRVVEKFGTENVVLMTADTLVEDVDNWRFAQQAWEYIGRPRWVKLTDGRTPMEAGRDERAVPNNRWAICSRVLKRELMRRWLESTYQPAECIVYLGFDWTEIDRWESAARWWPPFTVAAPLMDAPYLTKPHLFANWRARGIEIPDLNREGHSHANCGGCCVRGGMYEWDLSRRLRPATYAYWEAEEIKTQVAIGKPNTILKDRCGGGSVPLSLTDFRLRQEALDQPQLFGPDDMGACACDSYSPDEPPVEATDNYSVEWMTNEGWAS